MFLSRVWRMVEHAVSSANVLRTASVAKTVCSNEDVTGGSVVLENAVDLEPYSIVRLKVGKLVDLNINPFIDDWAAVSKFPARQLYKTFGDAGLLGLDVDREYGGAGLDFSANIVMAEQLGNLASGGITSSIGTQTVAAISALAQYGSHELKTQVLEPTIRGDLIAGTDMTGGEVGAELFQTPICARRDGDDLLVNGRLTWRWDGGEVDWMCLLCRTEDDKPEPLDSSLIIVPLNSNGVRITPHEGYRYVRDKNLVGWTKPDSHEEDRSFAMTSVVQFGNVRVPASHVVGERGMGALYRINQFTKMALWSASSCLLTMEVMLRKVTIAYETGKGYSREKQLELWSCDIGDLETQLKELRVLISLATQTYVRGEDATTLAAMCRCCAKSLYHKIYVRCYFTTIGSNDWPKSVFKRTCYRYARVLYGGPEDLDELVQHSLDFVRPLLHADKRIK